MRAPERESRKRSKWLGLRGPMLAFMNSQCNCEAVHGKFPLYSFYANLSFRFDLH